MGTLHKETWVTIDEDAFPNVRVSGVYHWFLPTTLSDMNATLDADVVSDITRATCGLAKIDAIRSSDNEA